jgi:hypothetical protein
VDFFEAPYQWRTPEYQAGEVGTRSHRRLVEAAASAFARRRAVLFFVESSVGSAPFRAAGAGGASAFVRVCTVAALSRYLTGVGRLRFVLVQSPSWPRSFNPQQYAAPDVVRPHMCSKPAVRLVNTAKRAKGSNICDR